MTNLRFTAVIALLLLITFSLEGRAAVDPVARTLQMAKFLKPISDSEWKEIAGEQVTQEYTISRGDTLWDVSSRLFGSGKYWPKIWALNQSKITNPHQIEPGMLIAFIPGSGTDVPSIQMKKTDEQEVAAKYPVGTNIKVHREGAGRSTEWKLLPRQDWEEISVQLPAEVDPQGFDKRNKMVFRDASGTQLEAVAATEEIPSLGEIVGSRSAGSFLSLGDSVYIETDGVDLQIGDEYTVSQEPYVLKSRKSDRLGLSYLNMGTVRIVGIRDSLFIGVIESASVPIFRGTKIMPLQGRFRYPLAPVPGPSPIEGILVFDKNFSTYTTAQHKLVFIDRGSSDGVEPGMIFRAYQHYDPSTDEKITSSDFIIDADFQVVQVSSKYSAAIATSTLGPVTEHSSVVLLTDVGDLTGRYGLSQGISEFDSDLDELDRLDPGGGLGVQEQKELRQLELWQQNPQDTAQTAPLDSAEMKPSDSFDPTAKEVSPEAPMEMEKSSDDQAIEPVEGESEIGPEGEPESIPEMEATEPSDSGDFIPEEGSDELGDETPEDEGF